MTEKKPAQMNVYVVLGAVRRHPPELELPADYPPLQPAGAFMQFPGGAKGARIHSVVDGPIEDIYTLHYVASADMDYTSVPPGMIFEPEAEQVFSLIARGIAAEQLGKQLVDNTLERVAEVVANETTTSALGWIADQRRKVQRSS